MYNWKLQVYLMAYFLATLKTSLKLVSAIFIKFFDQMIGLQKL